MLLTVTSLALSSYLRPFIFSAKPADRAWMASCFDSCHRRSCRRNTESTAAMSTVTFSGRRSRWSRAQNSSSRRVCGVSEPVRSSGCITSVPDITKDVPDLRRQLRPAFAENLYRPPQNRALADEFRRIPYAFARLSVQAPVNRSPRPWCGSVAFSQEDVAVERPQLDLLTAAIDGAVDRPIDPHSYLPRVSRLRLRLGGAADTGGGLVVCTSKSV